MSTLHYDELRKQAQLESWQRSEEQNVPLGYGLANAVEGGIQRGVGWLQEQAEDDPDKWTDDALRLMGGGLKNISKIPGMGLIGKVGEAGGYVGGGIAEMMGVDRRIGQFAGSMAADAALGFGVGKAVKIGRYTRALSKLDPIERGAYATQAYGGGHVGAARLAKKSESFKIAATQVGKETVEEAKGLVSKLTPKRNKLRIDESMVQQTPNRSVDISRSKYRTDDFSELDDTTRAIIVKRNKDIDGLNSKIDELESTLKTLTDDPEAYKLHSSYIRVGGAKKGQPRTRRKVMDIVKKDIADSYRKITDAKVRSIAAERMFWSKRKGKLMPDGSYRYKYKNELGETVEEFTQNPTLDNLPGMERHHIAGLAWSEPFFDGLNATQANELRDFAKKYNVFFGDDLNNRIDLSKAIHTGNKAKGGKALNIHSWLNDAGYSHKGLNLSGASMEVRKAKMAEMIDQVFREKLKMTELQLMDIDDLKTLIPPEQFKAYQTALREVEDPAKMITFNVAKANLSSEFKKNLRKQLNLNKRSEIKAIQRDVVGR